MSELRPHIWTIDERIDCYERRHHISPAFSQAEHSLAWSMGAAIHFLGTQEELPIRFPEDSDELVSFDIGLHMTHSL